MTSAAASSTMCCARPASIDQPVKFLQSFDWALPCVILADFWQVLGFYMIILLTGLQSIPQHLYEAARVDGVPACARFFRITAAACSGPRSSSASWSASSTPSPASTWSTS